MAEDTRRSFDLKSWQGLTEVLKFAREHIVDPQHYAEFRNLVLQYAQLRGTDSSLKERIDDILNSLHAAKHVEKEESEVPPQKAEAKTAAREALSRRRVAPRFTVQPARSPEPKKEAPHIPQPPVTVETPKQESPHKTVENEKAPPIEAVPVKSLEEHRARIMEIKRRVNGLVGNPITLVDHGNDIGRQYMRTLLEALKATSPGSTIRVEEAMAALETAFERIAAYAASPHEPERESEPLFVEEVAVSENVPPSSEPAQEPAPRPEALPIEEEPTPVPESVPSPEPELAPSPAEEIPPASPDADIPESSVVVEEAAEIEEKKQDENMKAQIKALREKLAARETEAVETVSDVPQAARVPSRPPMPPDSASAMRSILTNTPQSELMTPEVTGIVHTILQDWTIFSASGFLGLGKKGEEHPLYIQLSQLPMVEVLSGRFENADMKTVRVIKEYVNAWRHEQGIAYNPTETFEHYLRRVASRILKRQKSTLAV